MDNGDVTLPPLAFPCGTAIIDEGLAPIVMSAPRGVRVAYAASVDDVFLSVDDIYSLLQTFTALIDTYAADGVYLFALNCVVMYFRDAVGQFAEEVDVVQEQRLAVAASEADAFQFGEVGGFGR